MTGILLIYLSQTLNN